MNDVTEYDVTQYNVTPLMLIISSNFFKLNILEEVVNEVSDVTVNATSQ